MGQLLQAPTQGKTWKEKAHPEGWGPNCANPLMLLTHSRRHACMRLSMAATAHCSPSLHKCQMLCLEPTLGSHLPHDLPPGKPSHGK